MAFNMPAVVLFKKVSIGKFVLIRKTSAPGDGDPGLTIGWMLTVDLSDEPICV